jgi:hypothetical protein
MLEKEIIQSVEQKMDFAKTDVYRMYMDRDDIGDNMMRRWRDSVRGALEVSANLVSMIEKVYEAAIVPNEEEDGEDDDDKDENGEDGAPKNE